MEEVKKRATDSNSKNNSVAKLVQDQDNEGLQVTLQNLKIDFEQAGVGLDIATSKDKLFFIFSFAILELMDEEAEEFAIGLSQELDEVFLEFANQLRNELNISNPVIHMEFTNFGEYPVYTIDY